MTPYSPVTALRRLLQTISTRTHSLQKRLIELAEALGVEWRVAPGEAEAEAALMCKEGVVDAVVSDDVSLSSS